MHWSVAEEELILPQLQQQAKRQDQALLLEVPSGLLHHEEESVHRENGGFGEGEMQELSITGGE
jgi:hypothetical protein